MNHTVENIELTEAPSWQDQLAAWQERLSGMRAFGLTRRAYSGERCWIPTVSGPA